MDNFIAKENSAEDIAENGMRLISEGKVRNHKIKNSARIHTGTEEKREYQIYRDFLPSKNCSMVYELTGSDYYG